MHRRLHRRHRRLRSLSCSRLGGRRRRRLRSRCCSRLRSRCCRRLRSWCCRRLSRHPRRLNVLDGWLCSMTDACASSLPAMELRVARLAGPCWLAKVLVLPAYHAKPLFLSCIGEAVPSMPVAAVPGRSIASPRHSEAERKRGKDRTSRMSVVTKTSISSCAT